MIPTSHYSLLGLQELILIGYTTKIRSCVITSLRSGRWMIQVLHIFIHLWYFTSPMSAAVCTVGCHSLQGMMTLCGFLKNRINHIKKKKEKKRKDFAKTNTVILLTTLGSLETFFYYASINMPRKIIVIIKEKKRKIISSIESACWSQARDLCASPYT